METNKKFGQVQEMIVSKILYELLKGQSQDNAVEIIRQCQDYIPGHKELYK